MPAALPCLPLKFRLEDEAQICLPTSLSGFMPRHIEHPAPLHSNPASMNILSRPSSSAVRLTCCEPGTTNAFIPLATRLPSTIFAASHRSEMRALVHEPMNATSIFVPWISSPGWNPVWAYASSAVLRSSAASSPGLGNAPSTGTDWPGLMPQVTMGEMAEPLRVTSSSYSASGSEAMLFHQLTARANSSSLGENSRSSR